MKILKSIILFLALITSAAVWAGPVNINTANASVLAQSIQGVGLKKAEAIVAYRLENGEFKTIDALSKVKGIGPAILEKNRANLTVGEPVATSGN